MYDSNIFNLYMLNTTKRKLGTRGLCVDFCNTKFNRKPPFERLGVCFLDV